MLEINKLSFKYGKSYPWLFRDLTLKVNRGEILGITGKSGSGKTTLAKIIAGYLKPQKGTILFEEQTPPMSGYCPVQLVFQHPETAINPRWKMKDILEEVEGHSPDPELLHSLSINPLWLNRHPHELSGGELQRIAVARILNQKTRLIIADEMTSMLDPITQAQIWNTVIKFSRDRDSAIIAISHDTDLLGKICHRQITMD